MATLTGARDDLAAALTLAARFTASHKSNPQLNHLRLVVNKDGSFVEATDQRTSIRTALYAQSNEDMDVLAHPDIANAVKAMPKGDVTITQNDKVLEVSGKGKAKYTVATLDSDVRADAFPGEDELDWTDVVPIDASEALKLMDSAARYASRKEENPSIVGVNLRVSDQQLAVEATDGARLFHDKVPLPAPGFPFSEDQVMLPPRMVSELNRVFPNGEVAFAAGANLFFARDPNGETLFASRRIGGKFPDIERIVPEYPNGHVTIPRQELADALERMRGVVRGKPVSLNFEGDELKLVSKTGSGSAEEWVALPNKVEKMSVAFNVDYLAEAISLFEGSELRMFIASPLRPVTVRDLGERFFLLAPVKFN